VANISALITRGKGYGAYAEALQGLLSLSDAEGMLHPALLPPPPVMPPLALVDMAGRPVAGVSAQETGTPAIGHVQSAADGAGGARFPLAPEPFQDRCCLRRPFLE
jgi:hypothetical protein